MIITLVALCIFLYCVRKPKILIAICCIDERANELQNCLLSLRGPIKKDVIGIFRDKEYNIYVLTRLPYEGHH